MFGNSFVKQSNQENWKSRSSESGQSQPFSQQDQGSSHFPHPSNEEHLYS